MFERFTDRARSVITTAQNEAKDLEHNYIGTEHLLLALAFNEGIASLALESQGMTFGSVKQAIKPGDMGVTGHLPFTPRAKKVLELALREALQLNHNYIGTEHLLLAIVKEAEREGQSSGGAVLIFDGHGVSLDAIRQSVMQVIADNGGIRQAPKPSAEREPEDAPIVIDGDDVVVRTSGTLIDFDGDRDGPSFKLTIRRPDGRDQLVTFLFGVAEADG